MDWFPEDHDFYSVEYRNPRRSSLYYDPFADLDADIVGKVKRFNERGEFIEDEEPQRNIYQTPVQQRDMTKAEGELVPLVEGSEYAKDYSWWRSEGGYTKWLKTQNLDPDKLDSYTGNKMFTQYIAYKAEHPEGFMGFSSDVMKAVGGAIQGVSDTINKIPGVKSVTKPIGSIMQFLGNIVDLPRNVLAGAWTALSTGHLDEALPNMWKAAKYSINEIAGNSEQESAGQYFSWMDGTLINMVEKAKQGMSPKEYDAYINSDSFRRTKRLWQMGGMFLDLIVDPAWFIGAGEAKAMKAAKTLKVEKGALEAIVENLAKIDPLHDAQAALRSDKAFSKLADDMSAFVKRSEKLVDFVKQDKDFLDVLGMKDWNFAERGLVDSVNEISMKFADIADGKLKPFSYSMRLNIPFVSRELGGTKIGPSMQGMIDLVKKKIGGKERGFLSISGRAGERAASQVNLFTDVNRTIYEGGKTFGNVLEELTKHSDEGIRIAANELIKSPDAYNDFLSALFESNVDNPLFAFLDIPAAEGIKKRSLLAINEPLFKTIFTQPGIVELRNDVEKLFANSLKNTTRSQREGLKLGLALGADEDMLSLFPGVADDVEQLFARIEKRKRKEIVGFKEPAHNLKQEAKLSERFGEVSDSAKYLAESEKLLQEYAKYFPRYLTDEAQAFLNKSVARTDDPLHLGQAIVDYSRKIYIPVDMSNKTLQELVFGVKGAQEFEKVLAATPNKAFLKMNEGIRALFHNDNETWKKLIQYSDVLDEKGIPVRMVDVDPAVFVSRDVRPLVSQASISLLNELSKKGLIFDGFSGRLYKGGFESIYQKMVSDKRIVERLESINGILLEGQKAGWLKKLRQESDLINYDKSWSYQSEGIFKGFIIKDFLENPLKNAVKGIFGIVESTVDNSPWLVQKGKEFLAGFNRWWKVNIFMKNPGAHPRNFVSNRLMMMGDGISPMNIFSKEAKSGRKVWSYYRAAEDYQKSILTGKRSAELKARMTQLGADKILMGQKQMTVMEATEILMRNNVLSSGLMSEIMSELYKADEAGEHAKFGKMKASMERSFIRKWNPFGVEDKWAQTFKGFGSSIENAYGRLEYYFTLVGRKGYTESEAAAQVNKILIDYGRIGKTEDAIRRYLIPFYTWQSRMIPIMFEKALTQPVYFSKVSQIKNNAYNILELDKNFAPMGEQVMEGIPFVASKDLPKFFAGKPLNEIRTQYFSGEGWLPQAVVNLFEPTRLKNLIAPSSIDEWAPIDAAVKIAAGGMEYMAGSMTPALKVPIESRTGYSFQYKRPLQTYPGQTIEFLGFHLQPKQVNMLRSVFGALREIDDIINIFDKNAITGKPKYTVYDVAFKNLIGFRPYNRDEIREVNGTMGELRQLYQSNLSDARKMVYDKPEAQKHAKNALFAMHAIKALEWYKDFLTEVRDKDATIRGIEADIYSLQEKMRNPRLNKKQKENYVRKEMTLYERLEAFLADQERL